MKEKEVKNHTCSNIQRKNELMKKERKKKEFKRVRIFKERMNERKKKEKTKTKTKRKLKAGINE